MLQGQNWNIIRNGRGYGLETTGEINLFNKEQESVSAWYTAADFRARLRFPRTADEPPRRLGSCGVSSLPLFPKKSSPCPPINS